MENEFAKRGWVNRKRGEESKKERKRRSISDWNARHWRRLVVTAAADNENSNIKHAEGETAVLFLSLIYMVMTGSEPTELV